MAHIHVHNYLYACWFYREKNINKCKVANSNSVVQFLHIKLNNYRFNLLSDLEMHVLYPVHINVPGILYQFLAFN